MNRQIQKSIRFTEKAVTLIDEEVRNTLGIDFNEFLKVYVINKAEEIQNRRLVSPQLMVEIKQAKKEVGAGEKQIMKNDDDIDNYLAELVK